MTKPTLKIRLDKILSQPIKLPPGSIADSVIAAVPPKILNDLTNYVWDLLKDKQ